jgi:hypothetical protein
VQLRQTAPTTFVDVPATGKSTNLVLRLPRRQPQIGAKNHYFPSRKNLENPFFSAGQTYTPFALRQAQSDK